jgi:8-amino-7-oxononanoate synthase
MDELFRDASAELVAKGLWRNLRENQSAQGPTITLDGRRLINFGSNDYLGLASDERLRAAAKTALDEFGLGAGASRLISGTQPPHVQLERAIASWKGAPAALTFSSGYAAAVGTVSAVATKNDVIVLDKLAHASLIDGARLSGATLRVFPHNHLGKLESHLTWAQREKPAARVVIVTESIFSMDGDRAPLREIVELKSRFNALLFLDEAHAVGIVGPNGGGLAAEENVADKIDIQFGTLSKALGAAGGYICGSKRLIDWLINRARSFIYSTAPPPAIAAAATAAIEFLQTPEGEARRRALWKNIALLFELLGKKGPAASAILPLTVGSETRALDLAQTLREEAFFVPAIRYPTVARGRARLRLTVTAAHSEEQIRALAGALKRHLLTAAQGVIEAAE